ncbi:MAG TPA: cytochrome C oxidase subunit IV family protein [Pseudomonadales bacterium]|nr:cytochrome C oxidase subunit IV family protein [Pseudomonadales bacterium]
MKTPVKYIFTAVWAALVALLFGMFGLARLNFKTDAVFILILAAVQMFLVLLFFMRLRTCTNLVRLIAAVGFVWLFILFTLAFSDYLTRQWH